jgi:hypothetical protein
MKPQNHGDWTNAKERNCTCEREALKSRIQGAAVSNWQVKDAAARVELDLAQMLRGEIASSRPRKLTARVEQQPGS